MPELTRRDWIRGAAGVVAVALVPTYAKPPEPHSEPGCTLSIGTYSFKGRPVEDAVATVAAVGFDGVEIAVQAGFGAEPKSLNADRRAALRRRIDGEGLALTALMENLPPSADDARHTEDTDRLRRVFDLANELRPGAPPLVQTVLGGGTWEEKREVFRDRLGDWSEAAKAAGVVLAIKPHRGGAMSRPEEAIWLIGQLGDLSHLRMVFDYSHFAFRDMPFEETLRTSLPYVAHVAVKDAVKNGDRVEFALPGAGTGTDFDYAKLIRSLADGGYRGDVCCEVSSMVSNRDGYDADEAAKVCYRSLAAAFERSGVPRRRS